MTDRTIIERAFDLAKSGTVANIADLRRQLKLEGHQSIDAHFSSSPSLNRQLLAIMKTATPDIPAE